MCELKNRRMGLSIDRMQAQHEWENLRRAVQEAELKFALIDRAKCIDDMASAATQAFVGMHHFCLKMFLGVASRPPALAHFLCNWRM